MPYIETSDDLADELANMLGIYEDPRCVLVRSSDTGSSELVHHEECNCRQFWTHAMAERIRRAVEGDKRYAASLAVVRDAQLRDAEGLLRALAQPTDALHSNDAAPGITLSRTEEMWGASCDWGHCANIGTGFRWCADLSEWLPVCQVHLTGPHGDAQPTDAGGAE